MHDAPPPRWLAYGYLALSMSMVGSYVALSKPLVAALPVFLLAWLRFGIAALAIPHWLRASPGAPRLSAQTRRLLFLQSLLGNFLFSICMLYGVSMTSAVAAGIILSCIPAAVALLSWLFLGERQGPRVWLAVACAAVGTALATLSKPEHALQITSAMPADSSAWKPMLGNALVVGSVLCEAAYVVIGKRLSDAVPARRVTAIINLWGLALMTPLGLAAAWGFDFAAVAWDRWLLLLFYALAASVGTVLLWMRGLRAVPASQAGVFTVMLPIAAAWVGVAVLDERMTAAQMGAFAIALTGVVLATAPARKPSRGKKSNISL